MTPGTMMEVRGLPYGVAVETARDGSVKARVDGKLVTVGLEWRPAIFAGHRADGMLVFRWTDSMAFHHVHPRNVRTHVREPHNGTASQQAYVRDYGELC